MAVRNWIEMDSIDATVRFVKYITFLIMYFQNPKSMVGRIEESRGNPVAKQKRIEIATFRLYAIKSSRITMENDKE